MGLNLVGNEHALPKNAFLNITNVCMTTRSISNKNHKQKFPFQNYLYFKSRALRKDGY